MTPERTLIAGIGSPHGDDQVGWRVAESLMNAADEHIEVHLARSPSELLDWLDDVDTLVVCDACRGNQPVGSVRRWRWPSLELSSLEFSGTHDLGICYVLELATRIGRLPREVGIWGIQAGTVACGAAISADVEAAVEVVAEQIREHLQHEPAAVPKGRMNA